MSLLCRILSVLMILGLVSGTMVQAAQKAMMAGLPSAPHHVSIAPATSAATVPTVADGLSPPPDPRPPRPLSLA